MRSEVEKAIKEKKDQKATGDDDDDDDDDDYVPEDLTETVWRRCSQNRDTTNQ